MSFFRDKIVWITGASSGIGKALAMELARQGARLVLSARREAELQAVGESCQLSERDLLILPFDLGDTSNASGLAAQVVNKFGRIDVLINNGGLSQRAEVLETAEEVERLLMEVNYFGQVNVTKAVLPYMIRQKTGNIVVMSSIAGKFGFYLRSTYSAAKHALHGYFESLRLEYEKSGIKVLLVCPGKINTAISLHALQGNMKAHGKMDESHKDAMSAERCAVIITKAIATGKKEILVGGKELLTVWLKRFLPLVFQKVIRKASPY